MDAASPDAMRKLCHTTLHADSWQKRAGGGECLAENIGPIFDMGRVRNKHMGLQLKKAPLLTRASQTYSVGVGPGWHDATGDFIQYDKDIRELGVRGEASGIVGELIGGTAKLSKASTEYGRHFERHSPEAMGKARQAGHQPFYSAESHSSRCLGIHTGGMLETRPFSQSCYAGRSLDGHDPTIMWRPPTATMRPTSHVEGVFRSTYHSTIGAHQRAPATATQAPPQQPAVPAKAQTPTLRRTMSGPAFCGLPRNTH